jgi:hypothetical protein
VNLALKAIKRFLSGAASIARQLITISEERRRNRYFVETPRNIAGTIDRLFVKP